MHANESAWFEHQRKRWLRPDYERWLKPDWRDRRCWVTPPPEWAKHPDDIALGPPPAAPALSIATESELEDIRRELLALKAAAAALEFEVKLRRALKYNPDQPCVPAGNSDGGQWTAEGGSVEPNGAAAAGEDELTEFSASRKGKGHHYLTRQIFDKEPFTKETRKVFEDASTGPLRDPRSNQFDTSHRLYNEAVRKHYDDFLTRHGIKPEQMTPDHARALLDEILESKDKHIRYHNMRLCSREIMRRVRPRGNE